MPVSPGRCATLIIALMTLGGCGTLSDGRAWEHPDVTLGRSFAELRCAVCHATGVSGESRNVRAPPFGLIRLRYNELSLERELRAIAEVGHYGMPPLQTDESERRALIAYIQTLD